MCWSTLARSKTERWATSMVTASSRQSEGPLIRQSPRKRPASAGISGTAQRPAVAVNRGICPEDYRAGSGPAYGLGQTQREQDHRTAEAEEPADPQRPLDVHDRLGQPGDEVVLELVLVA